MSLVAERLFVGSELSARSLPNLQVLTPTLTPVLTPSLTPSLTLTLTLTLTPTRSCFTPHYGEDVTYSMQQLKGDTGDNVNLQTLLVSLFPDEWEHFCERVR